MKNDPEVHREPHHDSVALSTAKVIPAFAAPAQLTLGENHVRIAEACTAWLSKSTSSETRSAYRRELQQFLKFAGIRPNELHGLVGVRPYDVAAWRDHLRDRGLSNVAVVRKLTVLRSLFSYLQVYGYTGANPAHSDFVSTPAVPRDGKTIGLSSHDCRRLLDAPSSETPEGIRDRALLAVLAYTGCRVGELTRMRVCDLKETSGHRILEIKGKGGKERRVPLHLESVERLDAWLILARSTSMDTTPIFRPTATARGRGHDGFQVRGLSRRAVQRLIERYVVRLGLDPAVTVHSLRVTALTTARERGSERSHWPSLAARGNMPYASRSTKHPWMSDPMR